MCKYTNKTLIHSVFPNVYCCLWLWIFATQECCVYDTITILQTENIICLFFIFRYPFVITQQWVITGVSVPRVTSSLTFIYCGASRAVSRRGRWSPLVTSRTGLDRRLPDGDSTLTSTIRGTTDNECIIISKRFPRHWLFVKGIPIHRRIPITKGNK